jgi:hypothetical protein
MAFIFGAVVVVMVLLAFVAVGALIIGIGERM